MSDAEVEAAMQFAAKVAAITCTRAGADPPRADELSKSDIASEN